MRFSKETLAAAVAVAGCAGFAMDAGAADLNTNLIVNPGFEDIFTQGNYTGYINDWDDGTLTGYTYASGVYDNGGPLAGGGDRYFTSNTSDSGDVGGPGQVAQLIDLSTGDTAAAIAGGTAIYNLNAFFSTYLNDGDQGRLHVEFLDGGGGSLGTSEIGPGGNVQDWTQLGTSGSVPTGTASALVSVYGIAVNGGPDGYLDNTSFEVEIPEPGSLALLGLGGLALLRRRRA